MTPANPVILQLGPDLLAAGPAWTELLQLLLGSPNSSDGWRDPGSPQREGKCASCDWAAPGISLALPLPWGSSWVGGGFPLIPACIHAVARTIYFNDNCWISSETHLLYIVHGPICAALLVNLFFLLNIVRVLITKLKVTHQAESNLYMKAVRATLILVPLLGIEFVLFPWRPEGRIAEEIYDYVMHILMHYQGLLVATIFCFFNGEVQSVLRRHWNQYRIQFEHSFAHSDGLRSASFTVSTSLSDGQSFSYNHDCTSEHLNGKSFHDMDNIALKAEKLYG
ncbi:Calcitonin gene-related peptide type 1 receptor [Varanus komodoensis]|nr:Calcitonin gene-related peptide type 1 receptor [Varanus komodoensis]